MECSRLFCPTKNGKFIWFNLTSFDLSAGDIVGKPLETCTLLGLHDHSNIKLLLIFNF